MAEQESGESGTIWPEAVEIVPTSVVEALIARSNAELDALRSELDGAIREAEEAEERLRRLPPAQVFDGISEAKLFEYVEEIAARLTHGVVDVGRGPSVPEPVVVQGLVPHQDSVEANGVHPTGVVEPPVPRAEGPGPGPTYGGPETLVVPIVHAPLPLPRPADAGSDRPRTVVVDRSGPEDPRQWPPPPPPALRLPPPPPPPPLPPPPPPVATARAATHALGAEPALIAWAGGSELPATPPITRKEWTQPRNQWMAKVPSRLLMQLGALVVIVGLLVFKLG